MSRSSYYYDAEATQRGGGGAGKSSACGTCLRYTWKTITFLFSHITLVSMVVSYCILGAVIFQHLEQENERAVKRNISRIRLNVTDELWKLARFESAVLKEDDFTRAVVVRLRDFEMALLRSITKDGWDGDEDANNVQWSLAGALFYSIIVITTIGYGHIAPKTTSGKIVTIFYAILGIPLMLLCLSNIGDIMATSFRFIYWKVCCYVCTKKPKSKHRRSRSARSGTIRQQGSSRARSRTASIKRTGRTSTRSADSAFASSYSESELRTYEDGASRMAHYKRGQSLPRMRLQHDDDEEFRRAASNRFRQQPAQPAQLSNRGGSLDRRRAVAAGRSHLIDPTIMGGTKIVTNRYVVDENELQGQLPGITYEERRPKQVEEFESDDEVPSHTLEVPRLASEREGSTTSSMRGGGGGGQRRRKRAENYSSPKIMSPLGYGHTTKYLDNESDLEYYSDSTLEQMNHGTKPVPIWLCVFLVVSYIIAGTFLFSYWEDWEYLDAAYFCFITLTTIGFGDFVPAKRMKNENFQKNIAYCSLYLLFGIALLAMSFNLVQEEVIANVKRVAKTLGIIKREEEEVIDEDEEEED